MIKFMPIAGAVALLICCAPAFGQSTTLDAQSGSTSNSNANSSNYNTGNGNSASRSFSGSYSGSGAASYGNTLNVNNYTDPPAAKTAATDPPADPPSDPLGSAGNPYTTSANVSGTTTIRNTPDAVAPSVYAGTNPCAVGGSAAGAGPGIGISFGITTSSHECTQRAWYVLMMQSAAAAGKAGNAPLAAQDIQWARNIACNQIASEAPPGVCVPADTSTRVAAKATPVKTASVADPSPATPAPGSVAGRASTTSPAVVAALARPTAVAQPVRHPAWCSKEVITAQTTQPDVLYIHAMCGRNVQEIQAQ